MFTFPVPVFFLLPLIPVSFKVSMMDPFVSGRQTMTKVLRQLSQSTWNSPRLHVIPLPIIVLGSVPAPFKRTPPITLKKQDIRINVRNHINIGSRYHNHVWRSSKPDGRGIVRCIYMYPRFPHIYIYSCLPYTYAHLCLSLGGSPYQV